MGHGHDNDPSRERAAGLRLRGGRPLFGELRRSSTRPREARFLKRRNRFAKGYSECFGAIGEGVATGLTIRHDNGSQSIGRDFLWRDLLVDISWLISLG